MSVDLNTPITKEELLELYKEMRLIRMVERALLIRTQENPFATLAGPIRRCCRASKTITGFCIP